MEQKTTERNIVIDDDTLEQIKSEIREELMDEMGIKAKNENVVQSFHNWMLSIGDGAGQLFDIFFDLTLGKILPKRFFDQIYDCPDCHHKIKIDTRKCPNCGVSLRWRR